jgi:hypothetical protein
MYKKLIIPVPMMLEDMPKQNYHELHNLVVVVAVAVVVAVGEVGGLNKQQADKAYYS